ncbi:FMN-binding negative transcriptional regulator [Chitinophaga sp. YIM B06452]|uniref:FMN-binding negative transcriptional regulator n=1 Tax=Chitinophaga sp. YIM B06452 TaxID=3082158 RepID=UPI0031FEB186
MYAPNYHQEKDWNTIADFIRRHSFALLISVENGLPTGTHLPVELEEKSPGEYVLRGHIANANTQTSTFAGGQTFLVVFTDPHAYISSSWYEKDKIPTWNYIAVHVYGKLRIQSDEELIASLTALMNKYEAASAHPVSISDISEKELRNNLKAITGFEISIDRVDTRFKLSQNKNDRDHASVVSHLKESGDTQAIEIAAEMEKRRNKTN